jgi:hypothetical protein
MTMDQLLLVGWKDIRRAMGDFTEQRARRWAKKFQMPLKYLNRQPTITAGAFTEWWENLPPDAFETMDKINGCS